MVSEIVSTFAVGIMVMGLYFLLKLFLDFRLKNKMLNHSIDQLPRMDGEEMRDRLSSLKWGLITLFCGMGFLILELIPWKEDSAIPLAVLMISIGIGFLTYFFWAGKMIKQEKK